MIDFKEAAMSLETYLGRLQHIGDELRVIREEHLALNLILMSREEEGRQRAKEMELNATATRDWVKSYSFREAMKEYESAEKLRAKIEEKDLLVEGLNIMKAQIRLAEMDYRVSQLTPTTNDKVQRKQY